MTNKIAPTGKDRGSAILADVMNMALILTSFLMGLYMGMIYN